MNTNQTVVLRYTSWVLFLIGVIFLFIHQITSSIFVWLSAVIGLFTIAFDFGFNDGVSYMQEINAEDKKYQEELTEKKLKDSRDIKGPDSIGFSIGASDDE